MKGAMLALLAAAAPVSNDLPKLGEPIGDMSNWFRNSDWTSARAGGAVRFKVLVNRNGLPESCVIQATTGNKSLEGLACAIVTKRFRFRPALDANGAPAYRILVRSVNMAGQLPDAIRPPSLFSLTIKGFEGVSRLSVIADVNVDGSLAGCAAMNGKKALDALSNAVCQRLARIWEPLPELDSAGKAVRYVRDVAVDITHES